MKVRSLFTFDEAQLRSIRAAQGRGGRATRAECQVFINRAVSKAIDAAPETKPTRKKLVKPAKKVVVPPADTTESAVAQRERIKGMYRTSGETMQELADRTTAEGLAFFTEGGQ